MQKSLAIPLRGRTPQDVLLFVAHGTSCAPIVRYFRSSVSLFISLLAKIIKKDERRKTKDERNGKLFRQKIREIREYSEFSDFSEFSEFSEFSDFNLSNLSKFTKWLIGTKKEEGTPSSNCKPSSDYCAGVSAGAGAGASGATSAAGACGHSAA